MNAQAYPLHWPDLFPRAKRREAGRFRSTLNNALKNVQQSLRLFANDSGKKIEGLVISSNVTLGEQKPADPGVSVWFTWDDIQVCIPVDRYTKVEDNLQAIHHIIEARRTELRHGTLALVRASFQGFKALPSPTSGAQTHWTKVLDVPAHASKEEINRAYAEKAKASHPDRGGSHAAMALLNASRDEAIRQLQE